jgi:hypothetical protein
MSRKNVNTFGQKGPRQIHMNRTKYDPNKYKDSHEQLDQSWIDVMTSLCCRRCCDQLQWKVDYGKYTPLELPRKCNGCNQKTIAIAFHHLCQECSKETAKCAKCQKLFGPIGIALAEEKRLSNPNAIIEDRSDEETDRNDAALARYAFVDAPITDEEFKHLQGLDIRRLVQRKTKQRALDEKEARNNLRERERRTIVRVERKKAELEEQGIEDSDHDEVM